MKHQLLIKKTDVIFEKRMEYHDKICTLSADGSSYIFHPYVAKNSSMHSSAILIGGVYVSEQCFIGPYCVLRMDEETCVNGLYIGAGSNLQDHVVVHSHGNIIGSNCNVAHHAIIHGSSIGDNTTIYIQSVVDHAQIGRNCFIDSKCYIRDLSIPDNSYVPPGSILVSKKDLKLIRPITEKFKKIHQSVNDTNKHLVSVYQEQPDLQEI